MIRHRIKSVGWCKQSNASLDIASNTMKKVSLKFSIIETVRLVRSLDLLEVVHKYACGGLGGDASARRCPHFATTAYE